MSLCQRDDRAGRDQLSDPARLANSGRYQCGSRGCDADMHGGISNDHRSTYRTRKDGNEGGGAIIACGVTGPRRHVFGRGDFGFSCSAPNFGESAAGMNCRSAAVAPAQPQHVRNERPLRNESGCLCFNRPRCGWTGATAALRYFGKRLAVEVPAWQGPPNL